MANKTVRRLLDRDPELESADGQVCQKYLKTIVSADIVAGTVI
jgi:hypothetical protein